MNKTVKHISYMAMGIALYFVLGLTLKIPIVGHLQTDLGYIAFGAWCAVFGWQACIVGAAGCLLESLLLSGWFPPGWILGQLVIGVICGMAYKKCNSNVLKIIITVFAVFLGIAGVKTLVECKLYSIPLAVKLSKNSVAAVADTVPMIIGMFVGEKMNKYKKS